MAVSMIDYPARAKVLTHDEGKDLTYLLLLPMRPFSAWLNLLPTELLSAASWSCRPVMRQAPSEAVLTEWQWSPHFGLCSTCAGCAPDVLCRRGMFFHGKPSLTDIENFMLLAEAENWKGKMNSDDEPFEWEGFGSCYAEMSGRTALGICIVWALTKIDHAFVLQIRDAISFCMINW